MKLKKKRRLTIGIIVVLIIAAGAYGMRARVADVLGGGARGRMQTNVGVQTTIPVQRRNIVHTITATGNVLPARQVDLRFSRSGRVQDVDALVGDRVEAGQTLAMLDNREPELAYFRARNSYEVARIDSAPNVVREREIDMELSRDALEQTYLKAPFAGVVTDVLVEPGQSVGASDAIVQLVDDSAFEVRVSVDELDIARVQAGQRVTIRLDADPQRVRDGVVDRVNLVANTQGNVVTVPVTVRFLETDPFLRPGYTATLQIIVEEALDVVVVPVEAIWEEGNVRTVTRMVDGEARSTPVETGLSDGVWVEIRTGLEPGDQIVALNYRGGSATGASFGGGGFSGGGTTVRQIQIPGGIRLPTGR